MLVSIINNNPNETHFCINTFAEYEKEMEEDVADDLSGDFRSLIIGIINGGRDESDAVDMDKVQEDARV